jgi:hypothetical protein
MFVDEGSVSSGRSRSTGSPALVPELGASVAILLRSPPSANGTRRAFDISGGAISNLFQVSAIARQRVWGTQIECGDDLFGASTHVEQGDLNEHGQVKWRTGIDRYACFDERLRLGGKEGMELTNELLEFLPIGFR